MKRNSGGNEVGYNVQIESYRCTACLFYKYNGIDVANSIITSLRLTTVHSLMFPIRPLLVNACQGPPYSQAKHTADDLEGQ